MYLLFSAKAAALKIKGGREERISRVVRKRHQQAPTHAGVGRDGSRRERKCSLPLWGARGSQRTGAASVFPDGSHCPF